jgi:hypothetical protein
LFSLGIKWFEELLLSKNLLFELLSLGLFEFSVFLIIFAPCKTLGTLTKTVDSFLSDYCLLAEELFAFDN